MSPKVTEQSYIAGIYTLVQLGQDLMLPLFCPPLPSFAFVHYVSKMFSLKVVNAKTLRLFTIDDCLGVDPP